MTNVSNQSEKKVLRIDVRTLQMYREAVVQFSCEGKIYEIEINQSHIKDFIQENVEAYRGWFDANYCAWEQENNVELASEMAARVWKSEWMLTDYIDSLTDSELSELTIIERRAA